MIFRGGGDCSKVDWSFLGLSSPTGRSCLRGVRGAAAGADRVAPPPVAGLAAEVLRAGRCRRRHEVRQQRADLGQHAALRRVVERGRTGDVARDQQRRAPRRRPEQRDVIVAAVRPRTGLVADAPARRQAGAQPLVPVVAAAIQAISCRAIGASAHRRASAGAPTPAWQQASSCRADRRGSRQFSDGSVRSRRVTASPSRAQEGGQAGRAADRRQQQVGGGIVALPRRSLRRARRPSRVPPTRVVENGEFGTMSAALTGRPGRAARDRGRRVRASRRRAEP